MVKFISLKDKGRFLYALDLEDHKFIDFEFLLVLGEEGRVELILEFSIWSEQRRELLINLSHILIIDPQ